MQTTRRSAEDGTIRSEIPTASSTNTAAMCRRPATSTVSCDLTQFGYAAGSDLTVRDVWSGETVKTMKPGVLSMEIPSHGVCLLRITDGNGHTGIKKTEGGRPFDRAAWGVYTLGGRKVGETGRGVRIVNGKKVIF